MERFTVHQSGCMSASGECRSNDYKNTIDQFFPDQNRVQSASGLDSHSFRSEVPTDFREQIFEIHLFVVFDDVNVASCICEIACGVTLIGCGYDEVLRLFRQIIDSLFG